MPVPLGGSQRTVYLPMLYTCEQTGTLDQILKLNERFWTESSRSTISVKHSMTTLASLDSGESTASPVSSFLDGKMTNIPRPVEGSMDWLWYKPDTQHFGNAHAAGWRRLQCNSCDVYWTQKLDSFTKARCFCCGQFVRRALGF